MITNKRPQVKDVLVYDDREYIIQVIVPGDDSIVLTQLGVPNSSSFVLKGAQLRWHDMLQAWSLVNVQDLPEMEKTTSD